MSNIKENSEEKKLLKECCENKWVNVKDIEKLLDAEEEFKTKSRRSWINSRLLDEIKTMIDEENWK